MKRILSITLVLMFVAMGAQAQFPGQQGPKFYGTFKPVVGAWSEYQVTAKGQPPMKMKVAIVGKEGANYWYETVMQGETRMVSKMLVSGDPNDRQNLKRMIMKLGNDQAMEMDVKGMMAGQQQPKDKGPAGKAVDKGVETVTVPAGTFSARHMQYTDGANVIDAWVSDKVSPYGIVKTKGKDMEMVLTAQGTGAKTLITETPKKVSMPGMPQGQGMPKGMHMPKGMTMPQGGMPPMGSPN
jgi:hypothetical protein